jgi:RND superfamily putative drug exporter
MDRQTMQIATGRDAPRSILFRWGRWSAAHHKGVLGGWVLLLVAAASLVPHFVESLGSTTSLSVRGSDSAHAGQRLRSDFPGRSAEQDLVVFSSASLHTGDPAFKRVVEQTLTALRADRRVTGVVSPYAPGGRAISADGSTAIASLRLAGGQSSRERAAGDLQTRLDRLQTRTVRIYVTGNSPIDAAVTKRSESDLARAEIVGELLASVVLLLALRTVVAAAVPALLAIAGLIFAYGLLAAVSLLYRFDATVEAVATMLGLAVGIDYSLFLVTRFRDELRARESVADAVATAVATAGKAILFSGTTVLISLAGLLLVPAQSFTGLAAGAMVAVAALVLVAIGLLPAALALLGRRIERLRVPVIGRERAGRGQPSLWERWAHVVMRHPLIAAVPVSALLLVAAAPAARMHFGLSLGTPAVTSTPAGHGYAIVADTFPAGVLAPIQIVVDKPHGRIDRGDLRAIRRLTQALEQDPAVGEVESATQTSANGGRGATIVTVAPNAAPDSSAAQQLVADIRTQALPHALGRTRLRAAVGGLPAQLRDLDHAVTHSFPLVLVAVLGASFLLLLVAFRSLFVPLKAIAMNLLSLGTAYGLLVLVFQQGHLKHLFGVETNGFIEVTMPLFTFAILFGLSMDYEVFLVSRIKEEWEQSHETRRSVGRGLSTTARVISAAALIMVAVFASFMGTAVIEVKQVGFGLAVAVLVDATLVRLVLVPAFMRLAGDWNWWLPARLEHRLPGRGSF